ncbi:MAG: UPF0146 family protein [Candidatus Hydrothermarchaeales archaeon]
MAEDFKDFAGYIIKKYKGTKIVEIGMGSDSRVFQELEMKGMRAIATDIEPRKGAVRDDVTKPDMRIYEGAGLIYALRPPPELYVFIEDIARSVGADLIIKPLSTDPVCRGKLVNYKGTCFYLSNFSF